MTLNPTAHRSMRINQRCSCWPSPIRSILLPGSKAILVSCIAYTAPERFSPIALPGNSAPLVIQPAITRFKSDKVPFSGT